MSMSSAVLGMCGSTRLRTWSEAAPREAPEPFPTTVRDWWYRLSLTIRGQSIMRGMGRLRRMRDTACRTKLPMVAQLAQLPPELSLASLFGFAGGFFARSGSCSVSGSGPSSGEGTETGVGVGAAGVAGGVASCADGSWVGTWGVEQLTSPMHSRTTMRTLMAPSDTWNTSKISEI